MERSYQYHATVTGVIDGDTFEANVDLGMNVNMAGQRFRLIGVDTPERHEEGYNEATAFTKEAIEGKTVLIVSHGKDVFGRWLVDVFYDNQDKTLNETLLEKGLAVAYKKKF
jgi:micrococcal nuclease